MHDRLEPNPLRHTNRLVTAGKAANEFVRRSPWSPFSARNDFALCFVFYDVLRQAVPSQVSPFLQRLTNILAKSLVPLGTKQATEARICRRYSLSMSSNPLIDPPQSPVLEWDRVFLGQP